MQGCASDSFKSVIISVQLLTLFALARLIPSEATPLLASMTFIHTMRGRTGGGALAASPQLPPRWCCLFLPQTRHHRGGAACFCLRPWGPTPLALGVTEVWVMGSHKRPTSSYPTFPRNLISALMS